MQTITYWEVVEDTLEGTSHIVANFRDGYYASSFCGKNSYYRARKCELVIFDNVEDFENNDLENVRKRALAKLTGAEIRALGLK